jgi:hypothetical protein
MNTFVHPMGIAVRQAEHRGLMAAGNQTTRRFLNIGGEASIQPVWRDDVLAGAKAHMQMCWAHTD